MHRLFVAIRPPAAVRAALLAFMGGVPNARWQADDHLHLTLRFIGEVDRHRAEDIAAALLGVHFPSFALSLKGAGRFGQSGRNETLWIGVAPHDRLAALHKKIDQACVRAGVPSGATEPFLEAASAISSEAFAVDNFCLYESELGASGPGYTIAERYRLG